MGAFEIIFIAINIAVPSWLYFRSSESNDTPKIKWSRFEENMTKIVASGGGFEGCATTDVVQYMKDLCEKSMDKWTDKDSIIIERASVDVVFSCEARADATFVQWRLEPSGDADLKCQAPHSGDGINHTPAFVFDRKGELHSIEFDAENGERQSIKIANCRRKLELTLKRGTKLGKDWIDTMPKLKSDPSDVVTANRVCAEYDVADDWEKLRKAAR